MARRWIIGLKLLLLCPTSQRASAQVRENLPQEQKKPQLTKAPKLLEFVPAEYPAEAQRKGIAGKVELQIDVDAEGSVSRVKVIAAPDPSLARAAAVAVRRFRFSPAEVDGKPAPIRLRYSYNFAFERKFVPRLPQWMLDQPQTQGDDAVIGVVREQSTRLPVPGAAVAVPKYGIEVKADGRGRFALKDLPAGKVSLKAMSLEHRPETIVVQIREGEQSKVTFYLPQLRQNPYETVVRGKRRRSSVTQISLRRKQLTSVPGTFGDPVRVIENLPGLARVPYVGGALLVRGSAPTDSGIFLDGVRIPLLYHFLGGPSVLNPQFLDRIDYFPGNAEVRYGRLTAGTINVDTHSTSAEQVKGAVDVNLLNASAFLDVPLSDRVSVAGAVRRSYIDALLPAILDAAGQEATTVVPVYYDYQLRVDVKLDGSDRLMFLVFGSDDDLEVASNEDDADLSVDLDTKITFHRLMARWEAQLTPKLRSSLAPFVGLDLVNLTSGNANVDLKALVIGLRHDFKLQVSPRLTLRFGLDLEAIRSSFVAEIPIPADYRNPAGSTSFIPAPGGVGNALTGDTQPVDVSQWAGGSGRYIDGVLSVTDKLELIPGLRAGLILYFGNTRPVLDPRLTVRYALRPNTTLKGAAGMFSRAPEPGQSNEVFGNPNLQLEHAAHFALGIEQKLLPALNLDAQLYYLRRYGLAIRSRRVRVVDGERQPLFFENEGVGYSMGLELLLKHEVTRNFYGWIAYTLSRSVGRRRAGEGLVRFTFDQTHLLTTVASYRFARGWEAGLRFRLASGRPETPILGGVFDSDRDNHVQLQGEERSISRPLFHQLDLRIEKTWFFKLWRLAAYLDVQNVYNAANPEATLFDYRFGESGPLRGLPLLPTFGIKGSF